MKRLRKIAGLPCLLAVCLTGHAAASQEPPRPNIVLVMADDQGWGEVGYQGHPVLKTPHLDALAEAGLRFDRFYAGAPVCSPTRATVLTGRTNNRTGVESHGFALRLQEKTLAHALRAAGYKTAHFGKWHLNGLRGPGVPVLAEDDHNPGVFGFDQWLSVTNFFDRDPILSRQGEFEEFAGDSSEIIVEQALEFIQRQSAHGPTFTVIWYGTPHSPFMATEEDTQEFLHLEEQSKLHYGELVALDRSIGTLREGLRAHGLHENTILWYCSDNGGLPRIEPETVGGLRGFKGSLYEGGLRVPAIVEWPGRIEAGISQFPASTMDIFPTLVDILQLPEESTLEPIDGDSLRGVLLEQASGRREKPIPFNFSGESALVDNQWKLLRVGRNNRRQSYELYNLERDPREMNNLYEDEAAVAERLTRWLADWEQGLAESVAGQDYPEGTVNPDEPEPKFWTEVDAYRPYFDQWKKRPEYASRLKDQ